MVDYHIDANALRDVLDTGSAEPDITGSLCHVIDLELVEVRALSTPRAVFEIAILEGTGFDGKVSGCEDMGRELEDG